MSFIAYARSLSATTWIKRLVICCALGYLLGGALLGLMWGSGDTGNPFALLFAAIFVMIGSAVTFGYPPANEAGIGEPLNAWPWIRLSFCLIFFGWSLLEWARFREKAKSKPT